ncbi:MAG: ABC transporter permease, partial [Pseudomonadota bacterium]
MKALNMMLVREIMKAKGQFLAAAAVVFAGIAMFSASFVSYNNLKNSVGSYYEQYSFLDYYADVNGISDSGISRINDMNGVKAAIGRITADAGADMDSGKRVTVRLISLPDKAQPEVNRLVTVNGGYLDSTDQYSCLVTRKFAEFYRLGTTDRIKVIINLKTYELNIDGIVDSPEFVYAMKSETEVSPSAEKFGVVYISEPAAVSILGTGGMYNQVHVVFEKGVDKAALVDELEDELEAYGFISGTEREDQLSCLMVDNEIAELEEIAMMFPMLFLTIAATIIYIMQRRIINNQRTLIGVMKALGYGNARILSHYMLYSLMIAVTGAVPGVAAGYLLSIYLTRSYTNIFSIPVMKMEIYTSVLFLGVLMSVCFCLLAGYSSAKRVLGIDPAQAMRSETPMSGKRVFLERVGFIWNRLSFGWKMSIRNIFRSRTRTLFTIAGMMATIMFFMVSLFFLDSIDYLLYQNFCVFQRQDYKISFAGPASYYDALELESIDGIRKVEPLLELPVEIKNGWKKEDTLLVGITRENDFYRLVDSRFMPVKIPDEGMLIAHTIAEKLDIEAGDTVEVKLYLGKNLEKHVKVAGIVKQYAGFSCYMNIEELGRLSEEGRFATGALADIRPDKGDAAAEELYDISGVETVEVRSDVFKDFEQFLQLMDTFVGFMIFFGTIMGFAIIYNTTVINIMERRRE